jgi:hypothetical protein
METKMASKKLIEPYFFEGYDFSKEYHRLSAKAESKHGDNDLGKYYFWGNLALKALSGSPRQRFFQEQERKYRKAYDVSRKLV